MSEPLRRVPKTAIVSGWDFSTGSVKCLAFDTDGNTVAEVRFGNTVHGENGARELDLNELRDHAREATVRLAAELKKVGRLRDWLAGGVSATHHTAGRIDAAGNQVRRAICWHDQTLAKYHAEGLERLGGQDHVKDLIGGPWAVRYSLSHLVKDEQSLGTADWDRTRWIAQHGTIAAGYLLGRFDAVSVSAAASTGILDLRTNKWRKEMLGALADPKHREQAWNCLPTVVPGDEPLGPLSDFGIGVNPLVFPTLDDQAAGLVGGGATDPGHVALILGNSAVVNSSAAAAPLSGTLDVMKLNWGPYLWMRCYSNGAQFLDRVVGTNPDWDSLEVAAAKVPAGCGGITVSPFVLSEPSIGVLTPNFGWSPTEPTDPGVRFRAALEALAKLIALAVREHEAAGQRITRVTASGGIARSKLMIQILANEIGKPVETLASNEGSALGAAVVALAGLETTRRRKAGDATPYSVADAVVQLVKAKSTTHLTA